MILSSYQEELSRYAYIVIHVPGGMLMNIYSLRRKLEDAYLQGRNQEALELSEELDKLIFQYYQEKSLKEADCQKSMSEKTV